MLSSYAVLQIHGFLAISSKINESLMWPVSFHLDKNSKKKKKKKRENYLPSTCFSIV